MTAKYNENAIQQLSGLEHIRHRPSGYLIDSDVAGLMGISKELIDNSVDELSIAGNGGQLNVIMFINRDKSSYQICVIDNGRGIPVPKLVDVFSNTLTSGKFDTSHYAFSTGTYGIGSSVTLALSKWFRAISLNKGVIGDATIHWNNIPEFVSTITNPTQRTGTIVIHEPDDKIFTGIGNFTNDYSKLSEYLIQLSLFGKYRILFTVIEHSIPKAIRAASTAQFIEYIDGMCNNVTPMYDSTLLNKDEYIRNFFGMQKKWDGNIHLNGVNSNDTLRVEGDILISTANVSGNNKLTMINDILFTDNNSLHINLLYKFLKNRLAINIQDKNIKTFFLDHYKLPVWLVLNIKFSGAQFSGLAKTSFRDGAFRHPYQILLNELIKKDKIDEMYEIISGHIEVAFNKFSNKDFAVSGSMRNLMSRLNRPDKFNNCSTTDRSVAELFLVEGDSAKGDQGRDSRFQASYTLGGKPFNGLTDKAHLAESVTNIKNNAVFQDIIRILNINPGSTDLSNLNFGKTFIMTDADTHGYHITNITIGNLYALCPALIERGHVYITLPPLYSLNIKGSAPIYIRNADELNTTLAYQLYYRCIDVTIKSDNYSRLLNREEFTAFSELVIKIGDELDRLSEEYMIPAILLEQLSLITNHLNLAHPDVNVLKQWLGYDIKYVKSSHLLIISIGSDDVIVPLNQITELIYSRILPMYREFYYGRTRIYATTKNSDAMKESPITIVQINEIFKRLAGMFSINRFKGLGSMPPEDRSRNCLAPATRRVYQISSIGSIDKIFSLLGSDPTERKRLVLSK